MRSPGTTCPDPCAPKKPVKPARSWLSICKDPPEHIPCDIRHNNCPPPKDTDEPWYAFFTKKKPPVKLPPRNACRMEMQKQEEEIEPYCHEMVDNEWPLDCVPAQTCPPQCPERQPAPVIRLSCPPPKDLDLMLWCGRPGLSVSRIAAQCHSDRMPYEEFRPRKMWKPPPFSMPNKFDAPPQQPFCSNVGRAPLSEYKQVDIPKPLYTRYKSVELEDENFLLCMTDAKCPGDEEDRKKSALQPPPIEKVQPPPPPPPKPKVDLSCERPILVAASQKPVRLRCAPKFEFRSKPTKLVERRPLWNPCAQHKACNMCQIEPPAPEASTAHEFSPNECVSAPNAITGSLTDEPQTFQRNFMSRRPPHWMFMLSKPGSKNTPLVPQADSNSTDPDWCGETDGHDDGIFPKPPLDPCKRPANRPDTTVCSPPPPPPPPPPQDEIVQEPKEKFVLMPEKYDIRNKRPPEEEKNVNLEDVTFQEFIDAKTTNVRTCSKLYPQMKENILYDLVRNCPLPPIDPTKADPPPRKPDCPQPIRYQNRKYSTFSPCHLRKPLYAKVFNRLKSDDHSGKCKPRKMTPKPRECKEKVSSGIG